jgi:hypothetical protein
MISRLSFMTQGASLVEHAWYIGWILYIQITSRTLRGERMTPYAVRRGKG